MSNLEKNKRYVVGVEDQDNVWQVWFASPADNTLIICCAYDTQEEATKVAMNIQKFMQSHDPEQIDLLPDPGNTGYEVKDFSREKLLNIKRRIFNLLYQDN